MPERKKAGRRSNNEGCFRQRPNGIWEAQYIASYKPDGRPVRRSIYGKKNVARYRTPCCAPPASWWSVYPE